MASTPGESGQLLVVRLLIASSRWRSEIFTTPAVALTARPASIARSGVEDVESAGNESSGSCACRDCEAVFGVAIDAQLILAMACRSPPTR